MADVPGLGSADRRADWVALRTLRQRAAVVGRTEEGETVYEIRSVRLVLGAGANYFSQLVRCSKCGRAVPGPPVLTPADLDHAPNPVFCSRCSAGTSTPPPPVRGVVDQPAPALAEVDEPVAAPEPEDGRLAAVETQLAVALAQLRAMAAAAAEAEADRERLRAAVAALEARLAAAVQETSGRGELRAEVAGLARRIDDQAAALTAQLETHRQEGANELHEVAQDTMGALAEPLRALTSAHEETDRRLASLAAWAAASAARQDAVEQKVNDALAELRALVEAERAKQAALRKRSGEKSGLLDALDHQLRAAAERLAQH